MLSRHSCASTSLAAIAVLLASYLLPAAHAQSPILEGIVLDPSRSPVAGVTVRVRSEGQAADLSLTTNAAGRFVVSPPASLPPGLYTVEIDAGGFRPYSQSLDLRPSSSASVEIVLQLPENREVVTVVESGSYQVSTASSYKAPTPLLDVPQSITAITRDLIRDQSMQNMADVVRYIPGITMAQGEGHRDAPVIRGNATTADFYVNGVRDDVQYLRDLYNVERVEAVKGSNALTFGRGGGGGVINRVTKQPQFTPYREITLQGGTFGNKRATADLGHNFKNFAAFRLNAMYENSNSFRHDVSLERYGVSPTVTLRPDEKSQLRIAYEFFGDGRTVDRGLPSFQGRPAPSHRSTFFGDPSASYADAIVHIGSATYERQLRQWTLRNTTLVGDYDKYYQNIFPGAVSAGLSNVSISGYNNATARRNLFNQTDFSGQFSTGRFRHTLLIGSELGRQRSDNFRSTAFFNNASSISVPFALPNVSLPAVFRQSASDADNGATNYIAATFVQDQIELSRHLQVVAGLRFDRFTIDFGDKRNGAQLNRADNLVSPRLGLVLKPVSNLSLYGSYGVSYLPSSGDQFSSLTASSQTLKPEKFENYEFGAKFDLSRRLSLSAALYRLDRSNTTARDPNNPAVTVQTGSQRTNGFEAGIQGSVTRRWQVSGGYSTQDAFISNPTLAAPLGAKVALVPRHTFSLWNNYRLLPRWSMGLGIVHQASLFPGVDNTVRLPAFTRADVATFFSLTDSIRLQANLENLTDTTYFPTAHSNNNILPGAPRTLRLGLVASF